MVTESDHRKVHVQAWVRQAHETIQRITGQTVTELDFTDDRLSKVLHRLSQPATWQAIETALGRSILRVYELTPERVRLDATTVSGHHAGGEDSLFQFGHSKDDPTLRQVKVMMATLDPLGLPLVTEVVAGSHADDPLYGPAIDRVRQIIDGRGLLFVGDCKMSALATRAHIRQCGQHYLYPLPLTGKTAQELSQWVQAVHDDRVVLQPVLTPATGHGLAEGYAFERGVHAEVDGAETVWTERVLVVRSETYRQAQQRGLEARLQRATTELGALTPPPGRGKRQLRDEAALRHAADAILDRHAVTGLLHYTFERQEQRRLQFVGRGRGSSERAQIERVTVRYQITAVTRQAEALAALQTTLGWCADVTDAPHTRLTLAQAVLTYREEWLIERGFHRLKGVPLSLDPVFVKRDDQITGLTNLLSIAVRLLTLIEFVVRRNLKRHQEKLAGLLPQNPKKGIDNPTTERLLKMLDNLTLTCVQLPDQLIRHVTPLTTLQTRILELLGLSPSIYTGLADN